MARNGPLVPSTVANRGWNTAKPQGGPHPDAVPTVEDIVEVFERLAQFSPDLAAWLILGLSPDKYVER